MIRLRLPRRLRRVAAVGVLVALAAEGALQWARPAVLDDVRQRTFRVGTDDADYITLQGINFDPSTGLPLVVYDADAFWIPAPDRRGTFFLTDGVRTNALGLRGAPLPPRGPGESRAGDGEIRLLFLGDSVTFGMRVAESERYSDRLVETLRGERPATSWTAVNAGVIGYAATQVIARLPGWLDASQPDVVCLALGLNDCLLRPASDAQFRSLTTSRGERALQALRRSQLACALECGCAWLLGHADRWLTGDRRPLSSWLHYPRLPAGGQPVPRTSEAEFLAILERIDGLCRERGVPLVLVTEFASAEVPSVRRPDDGFFERLDHLCASERAWGAARGLPVADARGVLQGSALAPGDLLLDFCHPSPAGHALIAAELRRALGEAGLLDSLDLRAGGR